MEVRRRPAKPGEAPVEGPGKIPVLCQFDYLTRDHEGVRWVADSVMVLVSSSREILGAFEAALRKRQARELPRILEFRLRSYLTPDGRRRF